MIEVFFLIAGRLSLATLTLKSPQCKVSLLSLFVEQEDEMGDAAPDTSTYLLSTVPGNSNSAKKFSSIGNPHTTWRDLYMKNHLMSNWPKTTHVSNAVPRNQPG